MSPKKKKNGHPQDSDKPVESIEDQVTPESPEVESADDASTEQNDESGSSSQFGKLGEGTLLQRLTCHGIFWNSHIIIPCYILYYFPIIFC